MLDIKFIRDNSEKVKEAVRLRNGNMDSEIDELLMVDVERRNKMSEAEMMRSEQNVVSKKIPELKKSGQDITVIMNEMKELSKNISMLNKEISSLEERQKNILLSIPNVPNKDVPVGKDDTENVEIRRWGEPKKFIFEEKGRIGMGTLEEVKTLQLKNYLSVGKRNSQMIVEKKHVIAKTVMWLQ